MKGVIFPTVENLQEAFDVDEFCSRVTELGEISARTIYWDLCNGCTTETKTETTVKIIDEKLCIKANGPCDDTEDIAEFVAFLQKYFYGDHGENGAIFPELDAMTMFCDYARETIYRMTGRRLTFWDVAERIGATKDDWEAVPVGPEETALYWGGYCS